MAVKWHHAFQRVGGGSTLDRSGTFLMASLLLLHPRSLINGFEQVRLLVVAPNVDAVGGEGGLDEKVVEIIDTAREEGTPVVFALSK